MKVLEISIKEYINFFAYPQGVNSYNDFIRYVKQNPHTFILLKEFYQSETNYPYFIDEHSETKYINTDAIQTIEEDEIEVLSRKEYYERLLNVINSKCAECGLYEKHYDPNDEKYGDCRYHISLDGDCSVFRKKQR